MSKLLGYRLIDIIAMILEWCGTSKTDIGRGSYGMSKFDKSSQTKFRTRGAEFGHDDVHSSHIQDEANRIRHQRTEFETMKNKSRIRQRISRI